MTILQIQQSSVDQPELAICVENKLQSRKPKKTNKTKTTGSKVRRINQEIFEK